MNLMRRELKANGRSSSSHLKYPPESHEERIESVNVVEVPLLLRDLLNLMRRELKVHEEPAPMGPATLGNLMRRELKDPRKSSDRSSPSSAESHEERIERQLPDPVMGSAVGAGIS